MDTDKHGFENRMSFVNIYRYFSTMRILHRRFYFQPSSLLSAQIFLRKLKKPPGHWRCGKVVNDTKFDFGSDGKFVQLRDHYLTGLDVKALAKLNESV